MSIVDETNTQNLKVDMLGAGTMKAGSDGEILCRTINDLTVISNMSQGFYSSDVEGLPYPDEGTSPFPWKVVYDEKKSTITVRSAKKVIASKKYPPSFSKALIENIYKHLKKGIEHINKESNNQAGGVEDE